MVRGEDEVKEKVFETKRDDLFIDSMRWFCHAVESGRSSENRLPTVLETENLHHLLFGS